MKRRRKSESRIPFTRFPSSFRHLEIRQKATSQIKSAHESEVCEPEQAEREAERAVLRRICEPKQAEPGAKPPLLRQMWLQTSQVRPEGVSWGCSGQRSSWSVSERGLWSLISTGQVRNGNCFQTWSKFSSRHRLMVVSVGLERGLGDG